MYRTDVYGMKRGRVPRAKIKRFGHVTEARCPGRRGQAWRWGMKELREPK